MPRSGCSALHGVNLNLKKKKIEFYAHTVALKKIMSFKKSLNVCEKCHKKRGFYGHLKNILITDLP